ncbi:hypothetical protein [Nostoc sp.]|uniref:hypothetical protein n=1 Tax=Nostoc sp. TaxID=1180 RepID=UPI002FFB331D
MLRIIAEAKAIAKRHHHVLCQTGSSSASMGVTLKVQFQPKNPTLSRRESVQLT